MSKDLITINNLSKVYDNGFNALKSVDLKIKQGEIIDDNFNLVSVKAKKSDLKGNIVLSSVSGETKTAV